ncbi:UNVERIFIED_CONTAM: hypothetical protein RMT77_003011 [Armadillidium vulgare]
MTLIPKTILIKLSSKKNRRLSTSIQVRKLYGGNIKKFRFIRLAALAFVSMILVSQPSEGSCGNPDAKRLYDDLLSNYNKLVRPVLNVSDALKVNIKLKLSQLIDVNLKNQIMTTNLWVEQFWYDYKLKWDPKEYGGVTMLHVPSDHIWRPDIVLYNK